MGLDATYHSQPDPKSAPHVALYRSQPWYDAYMAALFESDRMRLEEKIRKAEQLILFRERELLGERDDLSEHRALNTALHALHALHSCMKSRS
jgi:hypothetical protein